MAAMNLSSGIIFIALVSHFFLGEELTTQKYIGFGLMLIKNIPVFCLKIGEKIAVINLTAAILVRLANYRKSKLKKELFY